MTRQPFGSNDVVPVVVIGASAGGLKQITALLGALPENTGAAYVVIHHLSSEHTSQLPELLGRATQLEMVAIEDGMQARRNRVHVVPEDADLGLTGHVFQLLPKTHMPGPTIIDRFMRTLAGAHGPHAIGIILSGSGNDGALGLKAIKQHGGLALVQDPDTAEHPSMPRSAIDSAAPDYVLETSALVEPLCNHLANNRADPGPASEAQDPEPTKDPIQDATLQQALQLLGAADDKRDFSPYKPSMLKRRLHRRMGFTGRQDSDSYLRLLQDDRRERLNLAQDFLISVTDFFRDTDAYAMLCDRAIPSLLADRNVDDPIRAWVPGCATGEEAYSIAIALDEAIQATGKEYSFIVFASDIDARALETARIGLYPESIAADISKAQLRRYFDRTDDHYRIKRSLRERVVFAAQNLTVDPPYSRLDLISCRNLLMYLQTEAQKRVVTTFHFALKTQGLLFLGSSETLSGQIDLFEPLDKSARLFTRIGASHSARVELPYAPTHGGSSAQDDTHADHHSHDNPEGIARDILLREFVPASVLINRKHEILCSYGATRDFLTLPFGVSSLSLIDMVRDEYRSHTRAITHRAFRDDAPAEIISAAHGDGVHPVRITARPLHQPQSAHGLVFVTFERTHRASKAECATAGTDNERQLADELEATRSELNTTIQALEASNEELKGSNEEVLSMNEELETSKEELESLNEELTTVNCELESKVGELETAHNDLQNLFTGTHIATLFLDRGLCIKRFTPAIKDLLSLITSDIGRPLSDISMKFADPALEDDAERVMSDLTQRDQEVRASNQRWYQRCILPYRTQDNSIDGVVVTFADITALKQASIISADSEQRLDLAMGAFRGGMWDMQLSPQASDAPPDRVYLSARLKELLGFANDQFPDSMQAWEERVIEADRAAFRDIGRRRAAGPSGLHYRIRHRDGSLRWFASYGTLIGDDEHRPARWIGIDRDITEGKLLGVHAAQAQARMQLLADAVSEMVAYVDRQEIFQFVNRAFGERFGYAPGDVAGHTLSQMFGERAYAGIQPCIEAAMSGRSGHCQIEQELADKSTRKLSINHVPQVADGQTLGVYLLATEIEPHGRRASDQIDRRSGLVYLQRLATIGGMVSSLAHDIKQPLAAINNYAGALKRMVHAGRDTDELSSTLDKIADQVQHAGAIVSLTRDFARERDTDDSDVDINTLIHRAVALTENVARGHSIKIHLDLHTPLPVLQCLSVQIEQIIINLMINAIDAMDSIERANRHLTLRTRPIDNRAVELAVTDTGEGIPADKLKQIFDSFYTSKLDGTGLGLSISKSIIEDHGGTLWAESRLDHGATFFVRLPANTTDGSS